MSDFPQKQFKGTLYQFNHLAPLQVSVPIKALATGSIQIDVTFGCHCFTEAFEPSTHRDEHRYTYKGELRAFDPLRYECSLELPAVIQKMLSGRVYRADKSYTYVAQITLESLHGLQSYSVFFALEKNSQATAPALKMFVKSAYLKPSVAKPNAQAWRFVSLAGQVAGVFAPPGKGKRP